MVLITKDNGITRCEECKEDLKNLQKHLCEKHGFPDTAIEGIGTVADGRDATFKKKVGQHTLD